jgi:hypothetical protein
VAFDGSGNFDRIHNYSADASAGIKILASRVDAEFDNFKGGLESTLTRDGQNSPSTDLPMGGQKHTNVGAAASVTQYMRVAEFMRSFPIYCAFGGTAEAMSASTQYALTSLTAGVQVLLSCPSVNTTTSVTLGLTGAGTATVVLSDGNGPSRGQTQGLHRYIHNGANWVLTDPLPSNRMRACITMTSTSVAPFTGALTTKMANLSSNAALDTAGFASASSCFIPGGVRHVKVMAHVTYDATASAAHVNRASIYLNGLASGRHVASDYKFVGTSTSAQPRMTVFAEYLSVLPGDQINVALGTDYVNGHTVQLGSSESFIYIEVVD